MLQTWLSSECAGYPKTSVSLLTSKCAAVMACGDHNLEIVLVLSPPNTAHSRNH